MRKIINRVGEENIGDIVILQLRINKLDIHLKMKEKRNNYTSLHFQNAYYIDIDTRTSDMEYVGKLMDDFCIYNFITPESIESRYIIHRKKAPNIIPMSSI